MSDRDSQGQAVLGFDLDPAPAFSREAFTVSPANRRAFSLLDAWPDWPAPFLNLVGPDGAGKSHLARIWASAEVEVVSYHPERARASRDAGAPVPALARAGGARS